MYLKRLYLAAIRRGKEPVMVVRFEEAGLEAHIRIRKV